MGSFCLLLLLCSRWSLPLNPIFWSKKQSLSVSNSHPSSILEPLCLGGEPVNELCFFFSRSSNPNSLSFRWLCFCDIWESSDIRKGSFCWAQRRKKRKTYWGCDVQNNRFVFYGMDMDFGLHWPSCHFYLFNVLEGSQNVAPIRLSVIFAQQNNKCLLDKSIYPKYLEALTKPWYNTTSWMSPLIKLPSWMAWI